ncbi:MAG TPA: hypothetical protein VK745_02720 [Polyangiaceae bacterium]|nr:hypothetical protein [Polyangiaceae bacterium]
MKRFLLATSLCLAVFGCNHDKGSDATAAASAAPVATDAPAAAAAAPAATDTTAAAAAAPVAPAAVAAVPAEEDYEPQAQAAITTANATQQLAAIEKELGK